MGKVLKSASLGSDLTGFLASIDYSLPNLTLPAFPDVSVATTNAPIGGPRDQSVGRK